MKLLNGIIYSVDMSLSKPWEIVKDREAWHAAIHGVAKSWIQVNNNNPWTRQSGHCLWRALLDLEDIYIH